MAKTESRQKRDELIDAIKAVVAELTDEVACEHVEDLIIEVAEEAISNHYGFIDDDDTSPEEPIDFYSNMDDFISEE